MSQWWNPAPEYKRADSTAVWWFSRLRTIYINLILRYRIPHGRQTMQLARLSESSAAVGFRYVRNRRLEGRRSIRELSGSIETDRGSISSGRLTSWYQPSRFTSTDCRVRLSTGRMVTSYSRGKPVGRVPHLALASSTFNFTGWFSEEFGNSSESPESPACLISTKASWPAY